MALAYDGTELRTYVNGQPACASPPAAGGIVDGPIAPTIGSDNVSVFELNFTGFIDELRIHPIALTREEIAGGAFRSDLEVPCFRRADANGDGALDISDSVFMLGGLFLVPHSTCRDALDANDDGDIDIMDPIYLLTYLFFSGAPPTDPILECGFDPTPDYHDCDLREDCVP